MPGKLEAYHFVKCTSKGTSNILFVLTSNGQVLKNNIWTSGDAYYQYHKTHLSAAEKY